MASPINSEKAQKLRPLRIFLAILAVILFVLVLDRLPTTRRTVASSATTLAESQPSKAPDGKSYYYFSGFLDILEAQLEDRLASLGVAEEDYEHIGDFLSPDEIYALELKVTLASELESTWVEASADELKTLREIFALGPNFSFDDFSARTDSPLEYKALADLLKTYYHSKNTIEDHDLVE